MARGEVRYRITADSKPFIDATQQASKEFEKFTGSVALSAGAFGRVASAIGPVGVAIAVAAGAGIAAMGALGAAVYGATASLVAQGGALADLSAQSGISTQALQRLGFAGSLVGVAQDQITAATVKMQKAIVNGDQAFGQLGLSVSKLRAMEPDKAFAAIAEQIRRIPDPAGQAAAAIAVFGKSGASLLPLIKSDMAGAADEAERLGIVLSTKTVAGADALGDEATKLAAAWEGVKNQFVASIVENEGLQEAMRGVVAAMGDLAQWANKNKANLAALLDVVVGLGRVAATSFRVMWDWAQKAGSVLKHMVDVVPGLRGLVNVLRDIGGLTGTAGGQDLESSARVVNPAVMFSGKGTIEAQKKLIAEIDKNWKDYQRSYEAMEKEIHDFVVRTRTLEASQNKAFWDEQYKTAEASIDRMAKAIIKASQDGDREATESLRRQREEWQRHADAVGTMFGGLANVVGGTFGAAIDDLGQKFAALTARSKGGIGEWFNTETTQRIVANVNKIVAVTNGAVIAFKQGEQASSKWSAAMQGAITGASVSAQQGFPVIVGAVIGLGVALIGHHKKMAEQMRLAAIETERLKAALQLENETEAQAKLTEAVQKYGFTVAELGPIWKQQELDKMAAGLLMDFKLLTASGIDHNLVLSKMGPAFNEYVQSAISAGVALPESMRGIIDSLIDQGLLLDANGVAYGSAEAAGITYTQTMTQMFATMLEKITLLVDTLLRLQGRDFGYTVTERRRVIDDDGEPGELWDKRGTDNMASGGIVRARVGGSWKLLGEGGHDEAVIPLGGGNGIADELRAIRVLLQAQPKVIGRAVRDNIQLAG